MYDMFNINVYFNLSIYALSIRYMTNMRLKIRNYMYTMSLKKNSKINIHFSCILYYRNAIKH